MAFAVFRRCGQILLPERRLRVGRIHRDLVHRVLVLDRRGLFYLCAQRAVAVVRDRYGHGRGAAGRRPAVACRFFSDRVLVFAGLLVLDLAERDRFFSRLAAVEIYRRSVARGHRRASRHRRKREGEGLRLLVFRRSRYLLIAERRRRVGRDDYDLFCFIIIRDRSRIAFLGNGSCNLSGIRRIAIGHFSFSDRIGRANGQVGQLNAALVLQLEGQFFSIGADGDAFHAEGGGNGLVQRYLEVELLVRVDLEAFWHFHRLADGQRRKRDIEVELQDRRPVTVYIGFPQFILRCIEFVLAVLGLAFVVVCDFCFRIRLLLAGNRHGSVLDIFAIYILIVELDLVIDVYRLPLGVHGVMLGTIADQVLVRCDLNRDKRMRYISTVTIGFIIRDVKIRQSSGSTIFLDTLDPAQELIASACRRIGNRNRLVDLDTCARSYFAAGIVIIPVDKGIYSLFLLDIDSLDLDGIGVFLVFIQNIR